MFRPGVFARGGFATLMRHVSAHTTKPGLQQVCVSLPLKRAYFGPSEPDQTGLPGPPTIAPFLKRDGVEMVWSYLGSSCWYYAVTVPYAEARDLLDPKIVAELPA